MKRLPAHTALILIITVAVGGVLFAVLGSVALIALTDSAQPCPPNMGCAETKDQGCSSWRGLLEPAWDSGPCNSR